MPKGKYIKMTKGNIDNKTWGMANEINKKEIQRHNKSLSKSNRTEDFSGRRPPVFSLARLLSLVSGACCLGSLFLLPLRLDVVNLCPRHLGFLCPEMSSAISCRSGICFTLPFCALPFSGVWPVLSLLVVYLVAPGRCRQFRFGSSHLKPRNVSALECPPRYPV
jgi:hypothetical protein